MDMREMFTIDGRRFSNMAGFYDEVEQVFICGLDWKIGRNLNAFNDILRGGFGRHEYGQPIHIQWLAYEKSVRNLGKETMDTIVEAKLGHGKHRDQGAHANDSDVPQFPQPQYGFGFQIIGINVHVSPHIVMLIPNPCSS